MNKDTDAGYNKNQHTLSTDYILGEFQEFCSPWINSFNPHKNSVVYYYSPYFMRKQLKKS